MLSLLGSVNTLLHAFASLHLRTLFLTVPGNFILRSCAVLAGLSIFAYFTSTGCDPVEGGLVENPNQVRKLLVSLVVPQ